MKPSLWWTCLSGVFLLCTSCSSKSEPPDKQAAATAEVKAIAPQEDTRSPEQHETVFGTEDPRTVWGRYAKVVQAELDRPGADPSDLVAKAGALGQDTQKVFEFMRDQVALEPYAGVLRGARGTLVAKAGNALDKALLAQELLKAGGIESRIVKGTLTESQAAMLLARFLESGVVPEALADLTGGPDDTQLTEQVQQLSQQLGLPESRISTLLQQARAREKEFWSTTDSNRSKQLDLLGSRLKSGGVKTAIDRAVLLMKLTERLRQHYWLQIRSPDRAWSDFDPSFADAKLGSSYGTGAMPLGDIPENMLHRLEFTLVYRTATDGSADEQFLIAATLASADTLFEPVELVIQPVDLDLRPSALAAMDSQQVIDSLRSIKRLQAVLRVGSKITGSRSFDLDGTIYDSAGPSLRTSGGTFFGDALGGGEEVAAPQFSELRVVMRLLGPGREPTTQTRTLVRAEDLMMPKFAPPLLEWEILLQPQWIPNDLVRYQALAQVLAMGNAIMAAPTAEGASKFTKAPTAVSLPLLQLARLRQSVTARSLTEQRGVKPLVDEPLLTILSHRVSELDAQEGSIVAVRQIDIVSNAIRFVAQNDAAAPAAFNTALNQGVADCMIEDRFLIDAFPDSVVQSGRSILEQAQVQKRQIAFVNAQDLDKLTSIGLRQTDVEWIRDNELPGSSLLVGTTTDGATAWWSVSADGNAILRTTDGYGSADAEYTMLIAKVGFANLCIVTAFGLEKRALRSARTSRDFARLDADRSRRLWECATLTATGGVLFVGNFHLLSIGLMLFESWHIWHALQ